MPSWTAADIPDQTGRVALVTGANTGIGFEAARALAEKGARVVLACRNADKAREAAARIGDRAEVAVLDLSDLDSVRAFAASFLAANERLDLLVLNAGVMVPPFGRTKQGFELQLGTNHLGHFALCGLLLPVLDRTPGARVVVVYSGAHRGGRIDFDDPNYDRRPYIAWQAYCQSKLANVLFGLELQRRLAAAGSGTRVTLAHPGWTATDLQRTSLVARLLNPFVAMRSADGALPTLRAAVDPEAPPASCWGPSGAFEMRGPPAPGRITSAARDADAARRLWSLSEQLTGVTYLPTT